MSPIDRTHPAWIAAFTVNLEKAPRRLRRRALAVQGAIEAADAAYRHVRCRDVAEAQALAVESTARREREWQAVQEIGLAVYGRAWLQADERSRICTMWYTCGQDEATAIAELASQGEQR